jgi:hypothetical protein
MRWLLWTGRGSSRGAVQAAGRNSWQLQPLAGAHGWEEQCSGKGGPALICDIAAKAEIAKEAEGLFR